MNSLYQRLKELSKDDFEALIDQLLQAKYPGAGITLVDGTGGDEGIDNFQGILPMGRPSGSISTSPTAFKSHSENR